MKRKVYMMTVLLLLAGFAGAVVDENGSSPSNQVDEGEMAITSTGSTASGTTAVGPNGTEYSAKVAMSGRLGDITNGSVAEGSREITEGKIRLELNGSIVSPTLCHVVDQKVSTSDGNSYKLKIDTVKENLNNDTLCAQQQAMINYNAEFEAEGPYELTVLHNGEEVKTFNVEDVAGPEPEPRERGFIASLIDFFTGLF